MLIIEAANVDLINPFPPTEVDRLVGWFHCYKSVMWGDGMPKDNEGMKAYCLQELNNVLSFGVIDKNNSLNYKHEAPMIGMIWFGAGATDANTYFHFTSTRRAW